MTSTLSKFFLKAIRLLFIVSLFLHYHPLAAQLNTERNALNRLQSGKWERSLSTLKKSLRKDTANLEANYVMSLWFLTAGNPQLQIDSSYKYILKSENLFELLNTRDRERVARFPIDSLLLVNQHDRIDSAAFERAKHFNTEKSYNRFIFSFPGAKQQSNAVELRDEVAFLDALKINTYTAYAEHFQKYPQSHRAQEAKKRYEKLLFEDKTSDKKLSSYKLFFEQYPSSPYRNEVQKEIFQLMTANGESETFFQYLKEYPQGEYAKNARDILYHLFKETDEKIPASIESDSLLQVIDLGTKFWIPFYKNGLYGFMDQDGEEVLPPRFEEIEEEYKCGPIKNDILIFKAGVFSRNGSKLLDTGTEVTPIGWGFLIAEHEGCKQLIHKSGALIISDCYDDFKVVGNNFIAAKRVDNWSLFTLTGMLLPVTELSDVKEIEGVIVFTQGGKKKLATANQLAMLANGVELNEDLVFDDVVAFSKGLLLVRNGSLEGIITSDLVYTVPLDRQTLTKTSFGLLEKRTVGTIVRGLAPELENQSWHQVYYHRDWLVLRREAQLQLYNIPAKKMVAMHADTIWFDRSLAFVKSNLETKVHLSANRVIDLPADSKITFINSRDSVQFFYTENKNKRTVFNLASGDILFTTDFEIAESIRSDFFMASKGSKKGLLGRNGKELVPVEMDAMILNSSGQISLLKNRNFGLFDLDTRKLIEPVYERNVTMLDKEHLIVFKDGFYGLIGWDTKPLTKFEFAEVIPWAESVIWVKKNMQWVLMNFRTEEVILDRIKDFSWILKSVGENVVRVHCENYYGVISNTKGLIIPPTFHEITNLGTNEIPFYFTEKTVEEADIYVVIYYNQDGKLVRRQAYEEEEYERIYCSSQ